MGWNGLSTLTFGRGSRSVRPIDWGQFFGLVAAVIGACQVALTFALDGSLVLVVGSGGWLLIVVGVNLIQNNDAFESGWSEDGNLGKVSMTILAVATIWVVATTVGILLPV